MEEEGFETEISTFARQAFKFMIKKVRIQNFKSVQNLELELGRLNVFIGENGCGKTNILEAIAMGSAAVENKIDNEFLAVRGIRLTEPRFMKSAFEDVLSKVEPITIEFEKLEVKVLSVYLRNDENGTGWKAILNDGVFATQTKFIDFGTKTNVLTKGKDVGESFKQEFKSLVEAIEAYASDLTSFLIYSPENTKLRQFSEEGQILPLGIRGEGLFKHLVKLYRDKPNVFNEIKNQLEIIDWFEDLEVPEDLMFTERRLNIKDRFLHPNLQFFDQRSSNEGFLYLLFYFTLFISEATPKFFAIDNIDNALNPKLCSKLIQTLGELAEKHGKQAILTTHNPSILDGLDLADDSQRLFVIYRNADGETTAKRVLKKEKLNGEESVRLSEAFIRGYLGGLPKNF